LKPALVAGFVVRKVPFCLVFTSIINILEAKNSVFHVFKQYKISTIVRTILWFDANLNLSLNG